MSARYVIRQEYRVGPRGAVVTWRDGSVSTYAPYTVVMLDRMPLKIEGRLFRSSRHTSLGYEAPALEPVR